MALKKKNRRARNKYPALDPSLNLKSRSDLIDYDYIDQLSEEEKAFLNKFTEEFVNASFNTKNPRKNLHKTKKLRQECYNRNNARNRDIFTKAKASGKLDNISAIRNDEYDYNVEEFMSDKETKD